MFRSKKLSKDDLEFLKANTNLSPEDIKDWFKGFKQECPSLKMDKNAFGKMYSQFYPHADSEKFSARIFKIYDKDNSGTIDFREFMVAIDLMANKDPKAKAGLAFEMFDINGDGRIEIGELKKLLGSIYATVSKSDTFDVEAKAKDLLAKTDTNKDGKVSRDEFITYCLKDSDLASMLK